MFFEIIIGLLLVWNVAVFTVYAVDKYKAVHHLWRIPEQVLLTMAILTGGLGAFLAGYICHHKTRKWYFQVCWYIGLVVDILLIFLIIKS